MVLDSVPSLQPKYLNGETFSEYGQPSMYTDYTSKGEAYAKFRDSTQTLYGIPPSLMGHQNFINRSVLMDPDKFIDATHKQNMEVFKAGMPALSSSSIYPSFTFYNSDSTTVQPKAQNALGSRFSFIRPKKRVPAYLKSNGQIDLDAMKNSLRPTNGVHFTDTTSMESIPEGLYGSVMNNYLSMPRHPEFPDKDVTIYTFHNNNSTFGHYPNTEFVKVIRQVLPSVNESGFKTQEEADKMREKIAASCVNESTRTLVKDFITVKSNDKYFILPAFD